MNTRRAILKLIGAAPAAASGVKSQLTELLASPAVAAGAALMGPPSNIGDQVVGQTGNGKLSHILYDQLQKARNSYQDEINMRRSLRSEHNIDPDIMGFKSVSPAHKRRIQFDRDMEENRLLLHAERMLWG